MTAEVPDSDELISVITEILHTHCLVEGEITPETDLQDDLDLDSLGMLTLVAELETHYRVILEDTPEDPPTTVRGVAELVIQHLNAPDASAQP